MDTFAVDYWLTRYIRCRARSPSAADVLPRRRLHRLYNAQVTGKVTRLIKTAALATIYSFSMVRDAATALAPMLRIVKE